MKNYRTSLLNIVTVAYVFLSGFVTADETMPTDEHLRIDNKIKEQNKYNRVLPKQEENKNMPSTIDTEFDSKDELQLPLDLSIPFKDVNNTEKKIEEHTQQQFVETNIFTPDTKKKPEQILLNGQLIKSPDPEVEKRKSVDGAGIVITLKP